MKWIALIMVVAAILPASNWLRQNPRDATKLWVLLGFLPFALSFVHLNMAFISWIIWPGYVKGAEFSLLDGLAIALYRGSRGPRQPLPFCLSMGLYFLATVLSAFQAAEPTASLFYCWQLARVFLVYAVVARGCADPRVPIAILKGMTVGLFVEVLVAGWQRFALGMVQAPGTMDHQNLLGMVTHLVALPAFALMLSGRVGWILCAAAPLGVIIDILTASRGALGFSLIGFAMIFLLSSLRRWTARKGTVLMIAVVGLVVMIPGAISSFEDRFSDKTQAATMSSDYNERAVFEKAASMMLSDKPMGHGANHYVFAANLGGYNNNAGIGGFYQSYAANVHNVYYLVAAETGYLGLITFVFMLVRPLTAALLCGWNNRGDQRGDLLIGIGAALLILYIHGFFEWIFVMLETQYMFAIDLGLVAGLATQMGYWSRSRSQAKTVRTGTSTRSLGIPAGALGRSSVES